MIIKRIFMTAIVAGLLAGAILTGLQAVAAVPLVLQAEQYEAAGHEHGGEAGAGHEHGTVASGAETPAWAPSDGAERWFFTFITNIIVAIGFGLLLAAALALRGRCDWREGLLWGLAGFGVFHLAPALGLPPELPGAPAADLGARQAWWLLTVVCTAGGLAALVFAPRGLVKAAGAGLLLVPHLLGAPIPGEHDSALPAHLAASFVVVSLATNAAFWLALGGLSGHLFERVGAPDPRAARQLGT